jgi:hypothetical protein
MGMRDRHRLDVGGLDAELVELAGERFRPFHVERAIGAGRALRRRGKPRGATPAGDGSGSNVKPLSGRSFEECACLPVNAPPAAGLPIKI